MNHLNIKKSGNIFGIIIVAFFILCLFWGLVITVPVLSELHLNILRIAYPWFSMSFVGIIIGIIESFAYGWIFGALFAWLCKKICISD